MSLQRSSAAAGNGAQNKNRVKQPYEAAATHRSTGPQFLSQFPWLHCSQPPAAGQRETEDLQENPSGAPPCCASAENAGSANDAAGLSGWMTGRAIQMAVERSHRSITPANEPFLGKQLRGGPCPCSDRQPRLATKRRTRNAQNNPARQLRRIGRWGLSSCANAHGCTAGTPPLDGARYLGSARKSIARATVLCAGRDCGRCRWHSRPVQMKDWPRHPDGRRPPPQISEASQRAVLRKAMVKATMSLQRPSPAAEHATQNTRRAKQPREPAATHRSTGHQFLGKCLWLHCRPIASA